MEDLKKELQQLSEDPLLSKKYRNRKLLFYAIRTLIAVVIFYIFWDYEHIFWLLLIYIPINLISLISILGWNVFLNKRIAKTQAKLDEVIEAMEEEE